MTDESPLKAAGRNVDARVHRQAFAAPGQGFFSGAGRKTHLEQLRHLSQWSRRVLVVTGQRGIGKSTLYRQLSATLEPRAKAARINAALVNSAPDVLNAVVQGFGIAAPPDADDRLLVELVRAHALEQDRSERFCIVMVDDAELLEARALDLLVKLAATAPLRVVLFGEVRVVPAVERAASATSASWHEIRLAAFDPVDVREYLVWRFREQGDDQPLPFTDAQIKEIARLSEGLPGRVDQMANVLLARIESAGREVRERRFPRRHRAILAVLVIGIGFVYLVWQPGRDGEDLARVERIEVPPVPGRGEEANQPQRPADGQPVLPSASQAPADGPPETESSAATSSDAGEAEESPGSEPPAMVPEASQQRSPAEPSAQPEPEPGDAGDTSDAVPQAGSAPEPDPNAAVPPPANPPVEEPEPPAGPRGAAWLMSQPPSAYTLQLVTFSTAERASAFLSGQANLESFALFRQQRDGRIQHVVIYGSFETRAGAEQAAAAGLPGSAGRLEPWIRTFREVQDAARTALQQ